jgi:thioredoxin-like negative regulator of GroEL
MLTAALAVGMTFAASSPVIAQATPELRSHATTTRWFNADVIDMSLELLVLVNFWSSSCTSCRPFAEQLERVVRSTRLDVRIVFVDIDANPELAYEYDARTAPVTLAFQDGILVGRLRGTALDSELEDFVNSPSPVS